MITSIAIFIGVLVLLVLAHEWGHYIAARLVGVRVEEFGVGFPPRLAWWKSSRTGTIYSFNALPFGGFVRLYGEEGQMRAPGSFAAAPHWAQAVILVAGVTMNALVAWILLTFALSLGMQVSAGDEPPFATVLDSTVQVVGVLPESPAAQVGVQAGDVIRAIHTSHATVVPRSEADVIRTIASAAGEPVTLKIERQGTLREVVVVPKTGLVEDEPTRAAVGVSLVAVREVRVPWWAAPLAAAERVGAMLVYIGKGIVAFFSRLAGGDTDVVRSVVGPVGIAALVTEAWGWGVSAFLVFVAFLSLNLVVLNLLPFPALDGGRLVVVALESLMRRPLSPQVLRWVHVAGFVFLIALLVIITYFDVKRLFEV